MMMWPRCLFTTNMNSECWTLAYFRLLELRVCVQRKSGYSVKGQWIVVEVLQTVLGWGTQEYFKS